MKQIKDGEQKLRKNTHRKRKHMTFMMDVLFFFFETNQQNSKKTQMTHTHRQKEVHVK